MGVILILRELNQCGEEYGGQWQVHMGGDSYNGKQRGDIFRLKQLSYCKNFFQGKVTLMVFLKEK